MTSEDLTLQHLEDHIAWYDKRSAHHQRMFKVLKVCGLIAAALIPLTAGIDRLSWVSGPLGALVVVLEGIQQLNQYHASWIAYRSTAEALKHEKFLYAAAAGLYANADNPRALLAERVEGLVSQEHAKWASTREESGTKGRTPH